MKWLNRSGLSNQNAGLIGVVVAVIVGAAYYWPLIFPRVESNPSLPVVNNSTVSSAITVPTEGHEDSLEKDLATLNQQQQKEIAALQKMAGVTEVIMRAFLVILGEANVPEEKWSEKLVEMAQRHKGLLAKITPEAGDNPSLQALTGEVAAALTAGRYEQADDIMSRILAQQDKGLESGQQAAAKTEAELGELALTRLRYQEAAGHFAAAARRLPPGEDSGNYLDQEAVAWYHQGEEYEDNAALQKAIDLQRQQLDRRPRHLFPLEWAKTQNNLGNALLCLGEGESGMERLEEAAVAFRAALQKITRDSSPLDWAEIQNNLGLALWRLGERESGTGRLAEAVVALQSALEVYQEAGSPYYVEVVTPNLQNARDALKARQEQRNVFLKY